MRSFMIKIIGIAVWLAILPVATAVAGEVACAGIEVRAGTLIFGDGFESGDLSAWGSSEARFQATRILDLDFEVRFAGGLAGDYVLHVKLFTPGGHHYQTLTVPITADSAQLGTVRRIEGYPRPLGVLVARPAAGDDTGETSVLQHLPVAGTTIVASGLYGRWTAAAYLDGATESCGPSVSFYITA